MEKVATLILNRNLPYLTDDLYQLIKRNDGDITDIFVIEAGSDKDKLSKYVTWYEDSDEVKKHGLRFNRGMNYGLLKLWQNGDFKKYDGFFLLTNDTKLEDIENIKSLIKIFKSHDKLAILSPCGKSWGEKFIFNKDIDIKYFWFIHNHAYLIRKEFIEVICEKEKPSYMNFLFDGSNFRGYGSECELIAKAYINDWAAGITNKVLIEHDETHLLNKSNLIKTENFDLNQIKYLEEGKKWMFRKYGFSSRWSMIHYTKSFYDKFFEFYPLLKPYKI